MSEPNDIIVGENLRLNNELKELRARVAAFESSRWWRLHPRFMLARLRVRVSRKQNKALAAPSGHTPTTDEVDALTRRFQDEVLARGNFTQDWFTMHIPTWEPLVRELEGRRSRILELGSFEGLSACFVLWRLPDAHVTCIDTFSGLPEHPAYGIETSRLEDVFDDNVALLDGSRVRKLRGTTRSVLPDLVDGGETFDLVYVDASHRVLDVLVDAALSWRLLAPSGIAIFDDYGSVPLGKDPMHHPTPAIDAFLEVVAREVEIVDDRRQLVARKTV